MKFRVALVACTLLWSVGLGARVGLVRQSPPPPSTPPGQTATPQTPPAAPPAVDKAAPKKNRFETLDDDDEKPAQKPDEKPAQKPDEKPAPQSGDKPAAQAGPDQKKSRFAFEEDEADKPKDDPNASPYIGTARCVKCHLKQSKPYYEGPHGREWDERSPARDLGCETCHGPGRAHDADPGKKGLIKMFTRMAPQDATKACMTCHYKSQHALWAGSMHEARNVTCVNCHSVHSAKSEHNHLRGIDVVETCGKCHPDKASKIQRSGHMPVREGKMDCSSCHNPHGSTNVRLLKKGSTINESCTSCHAEKRGPFLWEHEPVAEKCSTCHDPHGSSNSRMLITKETMLCQRCHISTRHPATPYDGAQLAANSNRLIVRGCVNCHQTIHGSNHPSGQWFQR